LSFACIRSVSCSPEKNNEREKGLRFKEKRENQEFQSFSEKIREKFERNRIFFVFSQGLSGFNEKKSVRSASLKELSQRRLEKNCESIEKVSKKCIQLRKDCKRQKIFKDVKIIRKKFDQLKEDVEKIQNNEKDDQQLANLWKARVIKEYNQRKANMNEMKKYLKLVYKRKKQNNYCFTERIYFDTHIN
jgi:hypothetical protein